MLAVTLPAASPARLDFAERHARLMRAARTAAISNPRSAGAYAGSLTITDNGAALPAVTPLHYPFGVPTTGVWRWHGGQFTASNGGGRFTSAIIDASTGNLGLGNGRASNFWRASVMVSARYLTLRLFPTSSPYRLLIDGRYVSLAGTTLATTTGTTHQYLLLDFGLRDVREVTLEGHASSGLVGGYVEATGRAWPVDHHDRPRVAFLGDSYVLGSAASLYGDGAAPMMGDWLGARMLASGSGGTGWNHANASVYRFDQRIAAGDLALDGEPELICLMASVNDRARDAGVVQVNALAGLREARRRHPGVPIVVFGCMPAPLGPLTGTASITAAELAVQAAVSALADPLCRFVPVTTDLDGAWASGTGRAGATTGSGNADWMFASDGVHPSPEGCAALGKRYAQAAIAALGTM
ncbi:SGNH/GDSL hydrolase family protein [Sphingomonas sp. Y38-1Y]|uniref:SGNH/GDSL hydrolase family protein n=1 Tax=Sphingomonas sp. Y38-1Y TaxID=3078265 RepID=UPI0028EED366|nr:SGNH/GDSL hydrolase family protein [Sphingomonas sp. Y38-1Y]